MAKWKINYKLLFELFVIIIIIIYFVVPKSYSKEYKLNDYNIKESYNDNRYNISIIKDDIIFDINFNSKYLGKNIVKSIETIDSANSLCVIPSIKEIKTIPFCMKDNEHVDYKLIDNIDLSNYNSNNNEEEKQIDNITIYNLLDKKYLIYNYKNFTYLDNKKNMNINLFNNDQYNIDLATKINDYLVIPNYDEEYNFKELLLLNINNLNVDKWNLNMDVSYDSYIVGSINNYLYLVDKKNKVEYEFDIKSKKFKTVGNEHKNGIYYKNNNKESISMIKLINNNISFEYNYDQEYVLENNKLYLKTLNNKVLISNNDITKIVYKDNNYIYYLIDDTLYYYDIFNSETKVMKYFEWHFNNDNMIFIY